MILKVKKNVLKEEKGIALIELLVLLPLFILITSFGIGFFSVVHTAQLQSIAARNYAFATFRHRASTVYFRDVPFELNRTTIAPQHFKDQGFRLHFVGNDGDASLDGAGNYGNATQRQISYFFPIESSEGSSVNAHRQVASIGDERNRDIKVSTVWMKVHYGLCVDASCGDQARN